eukprot:s4487_g3.t1
MACRHDVVTSQSGRSRSLADGCLALPAPSSWRKVEGSSRSECSFSASLFGLHRLLLALWLESWARHGAQRARGMRFLGLPVAALAVAVLPVAHGLLLQNRPLDAAGHGGSAPILTMEQWRSQRQASAASMSQVARSSLTEYRRNLKMSLHRHRVSMHVDKTKLSGPMFDLGNMAQLICGICINLSLVACMMQVRHIASWVLIASANALTGRVVEDHLVLSFAGLRISISREPAVRASSSDGARAHTGPLAGASRAQETVEASLGGRYRLNTPEEERLLASNTPAEIGAVALGHLGASAANLAPVGPWTSQGRLARAYRAGLFAFEVIEGARVVPEAAAADADGEPPIFPDPGELEIGAEDWRAPPGLAKHERQGRPQKATVEDVGLHEQDLSSALR